MVEVLAKNAKIREYGTKNLINASIKAGAKKMIAQSIAFIYEPANTPYNESVALLNFSDSIYGETSRAVNRQVLNAPLWG